MAYSSIVKPSVYFNTKLYTGNGGTQSITGVGFQPDWVWCKGRSFTDNHISFDAVRTATKVLKPNLTAAESTVAATLTSFDSDGFSLGSDGEINANSQTFASWNWKANGAGSSNTDGDINSTVSVNQTAGFSIVKYTGNGSNDQTVGHGLGARPVTWFIKNLSRAEDWIVYQQGIAANWYDDSYFYLNSSSAAMGSVNAGTGNPTTSVFYIGNSDKTGKNGDDYIAYVFAEKKGFSKFSHYTGNGNSDGPFVYTGFKPAFVMTKEKGNASSWDMHDNKRDPFNVCNKYLLAEDTGAEGTTDILDFCSNGFKFRTSNGDRNQSGERYVYWAFAEEPLVANSGTDGVPATAR